MNAEMWVKPQDRSQRLANDLVDVQRRHLITRCRRHHNRSIGSCTSAGDDNRLFPLFETSAISCHHQDFNTDLDALPKDAQHIGHRARDFHPIKVLRVK